MTIGKLASEIAKREGKKSQARIGNIREILKVICEMEAESILNESNSLEDYPVAVLGGEAFKKYLKIVKKKNGRKKDL